MTKLSILICTLPERQHKLNLLMNSLELQRTDQIEIRIHDAGKSMTTGEKRNLLIQHCNGEYFCFIDDDDHVPDYYVKELLSAIECCSPEVITFHGYMTTNGANRENFTIKMGLEYVTIDKHHYRFPNHLCAFKKSVVQHIKFPHLHYQEDYQWAKKINDAGLLRDEVHIYKDMYHYDYQTKK